MNAATVVTTANTLTPNCNDSMRTHSTSYATLVKPEIPYNAIGNQYPASSLLPRTGKDCAFSTGMNRQDYAFTVGDTSAPGAAGQPLCQLEPEREKPDYADHGMHQGQCYAQAGTQHMGRK